MKRLLILFFGLFLCWSESAFANEQVTISVNGVEMQTMGVLKDDRTFVPIRFVAENLGAKVLWNEWENTVYIKERPDEVIAESEWYGEDFEKMMKAAFTDAGLDFNKVQSKKPMEYAYKDENVGLLTSTYIDSQGNLIVGLYGEGTVNHPEIVISSLWYFDIETHEYGKICDNYENPDYYDDQRISTLFTYSDYAGNLFFFDFQTKERYSIPEARLLAVIGHTAYYVRDKLYVCNLDNGKEESYEVDIVKENISKSYTNGERIYIRQHMSEANVLVLDLKSMEVSECSYEETEFEFLRKRGMGIRKTEPDNSNIGTPKIYVNSLPVYNLPDAFLLNDRTYVPLRFIAEEMGAEVVWIDGENRVEINDKPRETPWYTFTESGSPDIWVYR